MPITLFLCYARKDKALLDELKAYLRPFQRQGLVEVWDDGDISARTKWEQQISKHLNAAQIILLLVSPNFMASKCCSGVEIKRAVERHERKEACVIPIILDHVYWQVDPLNKLQALPTDGKPVTSVSWHNLNDALFNVTEGIYQVVKHLTQERASILPVIAEETVSKVIQVSNSAPISEPVRNVSPLMTSLIVEKRAPRHILTGHTSTVMSVATSANGQILVSGGVDKTIKVWDLFTGKQVRTLTGHREAVCSVAISGDGETLVSGSGSTIDSTIRAWKLSTGKQIRTLAGHTYGVNSVAISANGRTMVSGSNDKTIKVWDLLTGKQVRTLTGHTSMVMSVAISADGRTLVSASADQTIKVWNLFTGKQVWSLIGHKEAVMSVAISADGQTLVSASRDKAIKVWDLLTGKQVRTLIGHTNFVYSVAMSEDGQTLVSAGSDQTIRVWDLPTGQQMRVLTSHTDSVYSIAISPDGQTLVSGSLDSAIKVWGAF
jgi:WD40 repeat protein